MGSSVIRAVFGVERAVIGMVHLPPLPGELGSLGDLDSVLTRALHDARALESGGVHGLLVQNRGWLVWPRSGSSPETIASMACIVREIVSVVSLPVGVHVCKHDTMGSLAIAHISGARFVRAPDLVGVSAAPQGLGQGDPWTIHSYRHRLGANEVMLFADIYSPTQHLTPLLPLSEKPIAALANDALLQGRADGVVVVGKTADQSLQLVSEIRAVLPRLKDAAVAHPDVTVLIAGGIDADTVASALEVADGVIVGTAFKVDDIAGNPIDESRVRSFMTMAK